MSKRIGLLFATSGHSGVDRVVANLLPEFARTRHAFDLLRIRGHGPYLEPPETVRNLRLGVHTKKLVLAPLLLYLLRVRPYALLTANHPLNRAALMARHLTGVPQRVTIRMGMSLTAQGAEMSARRRRRLFASMRRWYPYADAVIAPSDGVGDDLVRLVGVDERRLHVIRNPIVDDALFSRAAEPLHHPWFARGEPPVVLGVGSLEPRKDFATLVRAFARLRERRLCRLVILGEGAERSALESLALDLGVANDVDLPGFESNPYRYMNAAAVFALSSRREGASAVIVEALACGLPVVSTDCPSGPAEVLSGIEPLALTPVGDDVGMADRLAATLDHPPSRAHVQPILDAHDCRYSARRYLQVVLGEHSL